MAEPFIAEERLRYWASHPAGSVEPMRTDMLAAADEIERLERENARMRRYLAGGTAETSATASLIAQAVLDKVLAANVGMFLTAAVDHIEKGGNVASGEVELTDGTVVELCMSRKGAAVETTALHAEGSALMMELFNRMPVKALRDDVPADVQKRIGDFMVANGYRFVFDRWYLQAEPKEPERSAVKATTEPDDLFPWARDDDTTQNILLLVDLDIPLSEIRTWTDEQCQHVEDWAGACQYVASDNEGVEIPPEPTCVTEWRAKRAENDCPNVGCEIKGPHDHTGGVEQGTRGCSE